ncbi:NUDIX hydrolase [Psychrobacillus sp. L4]|uniref:NUDIX hydrolase n=1 Tax=Psychrobacillus sp. L4 TaxID=3236892 RepID=UPI0036F30898
MNDYIKTMREMIGNKILLTVGCGAIIEDQQGRILLQERVGQDMWGIPGGIMEIGETFEETVKREVFEETNLTITEVSLFGIYSGKKGFASYPNGDKVYSIQIIFQSRNYEGSLKQNIESKQLRFFSKEELPTNINSHQAPFIIDWLNNVPIPVVK